MVAAALSASGKIKQKWCQAVKRGSQLTLAAAKWINKFQATNWKDELKERTKQKMETKMRENGMRQMKLFQAI